MHPTTYDNPWIGMWKRAMLATAGEEREAVCFGHLQAKRQQLAWELAQEHREIHGSGGEG